MVRKRKKKRRINKSGKLLVLVFILLLLVLCYFGKNYFSKESILKVDKTINLDKIKSNYSHYVIVNKDIDLVNSKREKIGSVKKDSEIVLDDDYDIKDEYYKLLGSDYYIKYNSVSKIDNLKELGHNEYSSYKNYVSYDKVVTNDKYDLYVNGNKYYSLFNSGEYEILIKDDDKYGIVFNDRLVYINKDDVKEIKDYNHDVSVLISLPVLNYHYTVNREAGELNECTQVICMEDKQVEEEVKYLYDNEYYAMTMRDVYLFVTGKVKFPKKSVVITIDDGWYLPRMISILEKYKKVGTLFLIGSLASPNDYSSAYLEIHSHSWDMHTPGVCSGSHGGAILCWDKDKVLEDLKKSRESLNNTTVYCFPFYEYNDKAIGYLKEAGFEMAFIGGDKKVHVGDNLYKLNRYELVNYTDINTFIGYVSNT